MISDRLHIDAAMKQAHPEMEVDSEVAFVARCFTDRDRMQRCQEFWIEVLQAGLPYPEGWYESTWLPNKDITQYATIDGDYKIDEEATVQMFARIVRWARAKGYAVEKKYEDDFRLKITAGDDDIFYFTSSREVMCRRVVTGVEVIPAKPAEPAREVEVAEWQCEKLSFLGVAV